MFLLNNLRSNKYFVEGAVQELEIVNYFLFLKILELIPPKILKNH